MKSTALEPNDLVQQRYVNWGMTSDTRLAGPEEAAGYIERLGVVTLYPASPEVPNLFHAYVGDPGAETSSKWDSPAGQVYGWRWALGHREAGFYSTVVRKRPTWVAWDLLPAVLRLCGDLRTPDELVDLGAISPNAYRLVQALEEAGGTLSTGELRRRAGFPTGKDERAAYLTAVAELDGRLLLAKVFSQNDLDMSHALVATRYPDAVEAAEPLSREAALDRFLARYMPGAVWIDPQVLARHLGLPVAEVRTGLERLPVAAGRIPGGKEGYIWASV